MYDARQLQQQQIDTRRTVCVIMSSVEFFMLIYIYFFFFFQAEDGIRDSSVTGVQTCALPISISKKSADQTVADFFEIAIEDTFGDADAETDQGPAEYA